MAKLCSYFGIVGIASICFWAAALVALVGGFFSPRRTRWCLVAFAISVLGLVMARINSHNVSNIQIDRSPLYEEMRQHQQKMAKEQEKAKEKEAAKGKPTTKTAPATGTPATRPRTSTSTTDKPDEGPAERRYAYRQRGKQKREAGKSRKLEGISEVAEEVKREVSVRMMPEADVIAADRLDRLNLFAARLTVWLVVIAAAYDYLSRFNHTFDYLPPLPLAGRVLDSLFPKTHAACLRTDGSDPQAFLARFLRDVVRKGETFIHLGPNQPLRPDGYWRLDFGRLRLWRLPLLVWGREGTPDDPEFLFDAVWFGRYCLATDDPTRAQHFLRELADYLRGRTRPRAFAWRTVNVLWTFEEPPPRELVEELVTLFRETNLKLIMVCGSAPASGFDETVSLAEVGHPPCGRPSRKR